MFVLVKGYYRLNLRSTSAYDARCKRCMDLHLKQISWYLILKTITRLSNLLNWSFALQP